MTDNKGSIGGLPSIKEFDKLIIMANLYVVEGADFLFIMRQTGMTFGNLSAHMSRLEEAGYIEVEKGFVGKRPNTRLSLTDEGRAAFEEYRKSMRQLFENAP
jgi:DNA-binding MarR family transcriptional regulator